MHRKITTSSGSRISPRGRLPRGRCTNLLFGKFFRKLLKNERNWTERGGYESASDNRFWTIFTFVITNRNLIIWVDCLLRLSFQWYFFRFIWITDDPVNYKMLAGKLKGNHGEMWWQINQQRNCYVLCRGHVINDLGSVDMDHTKKCTFNCHTHAWVFNVHMSHEPSDRPLGTRCLIKDRWGLLGNFDGPSHRGWHIRCLRREESNLAECQFSWDNVNTTETFWGTRRRLIGFIICSLQSLCLWCDK